MTTLREAAQQALEALEYGQHTLKQISENQWESRGQLAMQALRAALAEPVQEPVRPYPFKLLTEEEAAYLSAKRSKFANGVKTSCEAEANK